MTSGEVLSQTSDGVLIRIYVQPKARREKIVGLHLDRLKVSVTEPPDRGRANAAVIQLLSDVLTIPRSRIELLRGETSRTKDLLLAGQMLPTVRLLLAKWLDAN